MAERLTTNEVIEHFEDYELDHMGWFAIALTNEVSVKAVMSAMPRSDSQPPVFDKQAEREQDIFEIDETLLRVSQLFNAGGLARHFL